MTKLVLFAVAALLAAAGLGAIVAARSHGPAPSEGEEGVLSAGSAAEAQAPEDGGAAMAAMKAAAEADKYLFALFWKSEDANTTAMRAVLQKVMKKVSDRADAVEVNVADAAEKAIVDKFGLDRAPLPLILALAPNGAVTGGFPTKADEESLLGAFASPGTAECMKHLQENKLVFLCVQNKDTKLNEEAMEGVRQFKADKRFGAATEIVRLDPSDAAEAQFLADLQIDPKTKTAVTVFLAPPGSPLAMFEGATTKEELEATLMKAGSACCGGSCGPGGCGP